MDLVKVLALLHEELNSLNAAIATLEQLQHGSVLATDLFDQNEGPSPSI